MSLCSFRFTSLCIINGVCELAELPKCRRVIATIADTIADTNSSRRVFALDNFVHAPIPIQTIGGLAVAHNQVTMAVVFDYDDDVVSNEFMRDPEALSMWMKYGPEFMPLRMNGVHIRVAPLHNSN